MFCPIGFTYDFAESLENLGKIQVIVSTKIPKTFVAFVIPTTMDN